MEYILQIDQGNLFKFQHATNYIDDRRKFHMHYHPYPEIYMCVSGNAEFYIEGAIYKLEPYDIMLVPAYMIHQPYPAINTQFERYYVNLFPEFFEFMNCPEYKTIFSSLDNFMYKIPGRIVKKTNYMSILNDIRKYSDNYKNMDLPVIRYKIGELLHIIYSIGNYETYDTQNSVVQEIIDYIDKNFKNIKNLDEIALHFNYAKSHLCFIFKKGTGITIANYITSKRIEAVKLDFSKGKSLSSACIDAGFGNYGNFAYNYKKIFGKAPKEDLK